MRLPAYSLIAADDRVAMHRALSAGAYQSILRKLEALRELGECHRGQRVTLATRIANAYQVSIGTLYRWESAFRAEGWRGLVDARRHPESSGRAKGRPPEFVSFVAGMFDAAQRGDDGKEVYRQILDRLALWRRTGHPDFAIPGYASPPPDEPRHDHPRGWSYESILRMRPGSYARRSTKAGGKAAAAELPSILSTRVGTRFLSDLFFDDQDYDQLVIAGGCPEAARPCGFNCVDYHSAAHLDYHLRLVARDSETNRKLTLTKREFTWFVIGVLSAIGYRDDDIGTRLIVEHATADTWRNKALATLTGQHSFEDSIFALTGGRVRVDRSGLFNSAAVSGLMFSPKSSGNPNFKAPVESAFRLVRTYSQSLPGQTGRHRDLRPADLHGLEQYERQILSAVSRLDGYWLTRLQHGLLTVSEWAQFYRALYRAINARTEHSLEGWHELGFTRSIWRLSADSDRWFPADDLARISDSSELAIIQHKLAEHAGDLTREMLLSPAEVVHRLCNDPAIKRLDPATWSSLIPREWALERLAPSNRQLEIGDPVLKTTKHRYLTTVRAGHMHHTIETGTPLLIYTNPLDPSFVVAYHSKSGQFIGRLDRIVPGNAHRPELQLAQLESRAVIKADLDAPLTARAATLAEDRRLMLDHNRDVLAEARATHNPAPDMRSANRPPEAPQSLDDALAAVAAAPADIAPADPFDV